MRTAPSRLQALRRQIYHKARSEPTPRFWGLFVHVAKLDPLTEAYQQAKRNGGVAGLDGRTFADIEAEGVEPFLTALRDELLTGTYHPQPNREVAIPKEKGKVRERQIPCSRDRVGQGALKLILEAISEADFCPNSYGYRPKRPPPHALAEVRRRVRRRMSTVIEVDLARYFDTIRHDIRLPQIARRVQDPAVLHLVKQILKAGGTIGVPQGGPFSPLAANIYLTGVDWAFDGLRRQRARGPYEAVNYHRFAEDSVITVSGHHTKRGWAARARQRLQEHLARLCVEGNMEKTQRVDLLRGEACEFLGFELRRVTNRAGDGHFR
jgi:RNA-directed DNA polymerase